MEGVGSCQWKGGGVAAGPGGGGGGFPTVTKVALPCPCLVDGSGRTWSVEGVNERMRFLRYHPGQEFKPHLDGQFERLTGPKAGDRSFVTLQLYLNEGG